MVEIVRVLLCNHGRDCQSSALQPWWRLSEFCSATMVEIVRVLLCNHGGNCCQFSSISFNSGQERLEVTVSPLARQYLSDKDHHRVMQAEGQVKRRMLALHMDRVALEEQQVAEEGETYSSGRF